MITLSLILMMSIGIFLIVSFENAIGFFKMRKKPEERQREKEREERVKAGYSPGLGLF